MLETFWQDLRHGTRMLAKNPGFSLVAILSIAIGVGANAAMFSIADGLMLRPLPIPDPNGLLTVSATLPTGEIRSGGNSYPDFADLRDRAQSFESLAAMDGVSVAFARRSDESARGTYGLAVLAREQELVARAEAVGVEVNPLSSYWLEDSEEPVDNRAGLVLGFAAVPEAQIADVLMRLRKAWRR